ncbi:MAG: BTAD domain-containing putative transcriptional regulator [Bacteroidota bacterium]
MKPLAQQLTELTEARANAPIQIYTLGTFRVCRNEEWLVDKDFGRDRSIQLFQFLVTARQRRALHKEQIIDRIWEDIDPNSADQTFKVALHGINKALEPNRPPRTEPKYILRQGITYQLTFDELWIDAAALENYIALANQLIQEDQSLAIEAYREAIDLHHGIYLPERLYEDWSSAERERLQVLTLGAMITLAELLLPTMPMESVRLAQQALLIDPAWEDAYRIEMQAYLAKGNRPQAIKTYQQCEEVLMEEFGVKPLPETRKLLKEIEAI